MCHYFLIYIENCIFYVYLLIEINGIIQKSEYK